MFVNLFVTLQDYWKTVSNSRLWDRGV